jgi:hypothetical protein
MVLKLGAGAGVALVGAGAWRAWDQGVFSSGEGPAYSAWQTWSNDSPSPVHRLLRAAILAANPHNSQPWRFRVTPGAIDVFADRARNIGSIDPYLREMHIGLGCALENLLLAAPAASFGYDLDLLPNASDATHVARVRLHPQDGSPSALYPAIPHRHTNRGPYESRAVTSALLDELQDLGADLPLVTVKWITDAKGRSRLGELIIQATQAIIADRDQSRDSAAWFRADWREIQQRRDGLTIDAQALPAWLRVAAKVLPPASQEQADSFWLANTRDVHVATAAAYGIILARDSADNANRIQGGRLWQRIQLKGETQGIAMQPLNQLPERADRERSLGIDNRFGSALKDVTGDSAWQALMPFRLGYPTMAARASPRRHIEEVIIA